MLRFALRFPGFGDLRSSRSLASFLHGSSTHVLVQSWRRVVADSLHRKTPKKHKKFTAKFYALTRRVSKLTYASVTLTLRQPYAAEIAALRLRCTCISTNWSIAAMLSWKSLPSFFSLLPYKLCTSFSQPDLPFHVYYSVSPSSHLALVVIMCA